jgi:hypothetical protein
MDLKKTWSTTADPTWQAVGTPSQANWQAGKVVDFNHSFPPTSASTKQKISCTLLSWGRLITKARFLLLWTACWSGGYAALDCTLDEVQLSKSVKSGLEFGPMLGE